MQPSIPVPTLATQLPLVSIDEALTNTLVTFFIKYAIPFRLVNIVYIPSSDNLLTSSLPSPFGGLSTTINVND